MKRRAFARIANFAIVTALISAAPAAADTSISGFVVASAAPALTEVASAYEKTHPGVSIRVLPAGSKIIVDNLNRGLANDFVIVGDAFASKTTAIADPVHLFSDRTVIVVAPGAKAKITKAADLANSGVRIGWGSVGSNPDIFAGQTLDNVAAQYGGDYVSHVKANITLRRTDNDQIMKALDGGSIDAAIVFLSNTVGSDTGTVDLGDKSVTVEFVGGVVKSSTNAAQTKDFLAYIRGPQGQAIMHKYKHGT